MENRSHVVAPRRVGSNWMCSLFISVFVRPCAVKLATRHSKDPDRWDLCVVLCMVPATAAAPCSHLFYVCTFGVPLFHDNFWVVFVASGEVCFSLFFWVFSFFFFLDGRGNKIFRLKGAFPSQKLIHHWWHPARQQQQHVRGFPNKTHIKHMQFV